MRCSYCPTVHWIIHTWDNLICIRHSATLNIWGIQHFIYIYIYIVLYMYTYIVELLYNTVYHSMINLVANAFWSIYTYHQVPQNKAHQIPTLKRLSYCLAAIPWSQMLSREWRCSFLTLTYSYSYLLLLRLRYKISVKPSYLFVNASVSDSVTTDHHSWAQSRLNITKQYTQVYKSLTMTLGLILAWCFPNGSFCLYRNAWCLMRTWTSPWW